ncbi:MAG: DNA translocase FtsK, partial [Candidatus Promineifilaceae bacterium]|nr:DNA translocase FtsK [Candidatus Promineifilaceae bacterium]
LLSAVTLLQLLGLTSAGWLAWWGRFWQRLAGWGVYPLFLSLLAAGLYLVLRRWDLPFRVQISQVIGLELALLSALPLTYQIAGGTLPAAYQGRAGGLIGWALAAPLLDFLGVLLTPLLYVSLLLWGVALILRLGWDDVSQTLSTLSATLQQWAEEMEPPPRPPAPPPPPSKPATPPPEPPDSGVMVVDDAPRPQRRPVAEGERDPRLPSIDMLEKGTVINLSDEEIERKKAIIEQTLEDFGLKGTVTEIRRGPSVTQFGVTPGYLERTGPDGEPKLKKIRVSQIASLRKDLALSLAVPRLRIEAPVPGRGIVGVEVPNAATNVVRLRTLLESQAFTRLNAPLAIGLGQGVSGAPLAVDLAKMPHLLIAGTTGSGKSVSLTAFVACLVFNNTPERLRLVMIDPKKVELIRFNGLPHLLGNVEVEQERITGVLRWLIMEMDRRYEAFAELGAKNLEAYNQKAPRRGGEPLPYIAVFIDEMADLMAMYGEEVEAALCRLAQMARATGIHLVVATQRPSTDVITGLIKANFPARISFAVASGTDSRVILDTVGAEQLLGQGDMLFLSPEAGEPVRIQGCFVGDNEIERLVTHWRRVMPEAAPEEAPWEKLIAREEVIAGTDDMLEEAIELAKKRDTISTSLIQRRLRVGYPRAARLMEALYELDLVEDPKEGGRTRRTFVDEDDNPLDDYVSGEPEE